MHSKINLLQETSMRSIFDVAFFLINAKERLLSWVNFIWPVRNAKTLRKVTKTFL